MATEHNCAFPFEQIHRADGNYFHTIQEAKDAGFDEDQIWSLVVSDHDEDDGATYTYGPSRHRVNLLCYVATRERHDDDTYYHEVVEADSYFIPVWHGRPEDLTDEDMASFGLEI